MVRFITYKKEELPVRLSYRVFKGLKQDLKSIDESKFDDMDPEVLETMLWHGLKSGYAAEGKDFNLTRDQMEDVLDECMMDFLSYLPEFFPKSKMGNVLKNLNGNVPKEIQDEELNSIT